MPIVRKPVRIVRRTTEPSGAARFWRKVRRCANGCWIWRAARIQDGYGTLSRGGVTVLAHRFSYELNVGPIPAGLHVLHRCDTPACVNPAHLFLGTNADNQRDKSVKGRAAKGLGEANTNAKLSRKQVQAIRRAYAKGGVTQSELGAQYNVCESSISYAVNRATWK